MPEPSHSPKDIVLFLYEADFGSKPELILRYGVIFGLGAFAGVLFDMAILFFWLAAYASTEVAYFLTLKRALKHPTVKNAHLAQLCYFATASTFVAFPMYVLHSDTPALVASAVAVQIGMIMFTLWRPRSFTMIAKFDVVLVAAFSINGVFAFRDTMEGGWELFVFAVALFTVAAYYGMTVFRNLEMQQSHDARRRLEEEAARMEAMGRLVGGVAHDFNNILTVVLGNLELHKTVPDGSDREALLRDAQKAAERAAKLTAQLLAYSRRATLSPTTAELSDHVSDVRPLLRRLLPESIALEVHILPGSGKIHVDPAQFTAALLNLISNATDAMGDASGKVTLHGWSIEEPDGTRNVILSVTDTAGGLTPEAEAHALEPYFTTKPVGRGSGLGLPMVKGFAEQSGGRLTLSNKPGEGLSVIMVFPEASSRAQTQGATGRNTPGDLNAPQPM